ncbi:unnamed protein product [Amoebophrya sp. A25]|nr:unnamed protein product [Amoebophrya sp. A25]|eukprot:GSA25T00011259001.1
MSEDADNPADTPRGGQQSPPQPLTSDFMGGFDLPCCAFDSSLPRMLDHFSPDRDDTLIPTLADGRSDAFLSAPVRVGGGDGGEDEPGESSDSERNADLIANLLRDAGEDNSSSDVAQQDAGENVQDDSVEEYNFSEQDEDDDDAIASAGESVSIPEDEDVIESGEADSGDEGAELIPRDTGDKDSPAREDGTDNGVAFDSEKQEPAHQYEEQGAFASPPADCLSSLGLLREHDSSRNRHAYSDSGDVKTILNKSASAASALTVDVHGQLLEKSSTTSSLAETADQQALNLPQRHQESEKLEKRAEATQDERSSEVDVEDNADMLRGEDSPFLLPSSDDADLRFDDEDAESRQGHQESQEEDEHDAFGLDAFLRGAGRGSHQDKLSIGGDEDDEMGLDAFLNLGGGEGQHMAELLSMASSDAGDKESDEPVSLDEGSHCSQAPFEAVQDENSSHIREEPDQHQLQHGVDPFGFESLALRPICVCSDSGEESDGLLERFNRSTALRLPQSIAGASKMFAEGEHMREPTLMPADGFSDSNPQLLATWATSQEGSHPHGYVGRPLGVWRVAVNNLVKGCETTLPSGEWQIVRPGGSRNFETLSRKPTVRIVVHLEETASVANASGKSQFSATVREVDYLLDEAVDEGARPRPGPSGAARNKAGFIGEVKQLKSTKKIAFLPRLAEGARPKEIERANQYLRRLIAGQNAEIEFLETRLQNLENTVGRIPGKKQRDNRASTVHSGYLRSPISSRLTVSHTDKEGAVFFDGQHANQQLSKILSKDSNSYPLPTPNSDCPTTGAEDSCWTSWPPASKESTLRGGSTSGESLYHDREQKNQDEHDHARPGAYNAGENEHGEEEHNQDQERTPNAPKQLYITKQLLYVRKWPSIRADLRGQLMSGRTVEVLGFFAADWALIRTLRSLGGRHTGSRSASSSGESFKGLTGFVQFVTAPTSSSSAVVSSTPNAPTLVPVSASFGLGQHVARIFGETATLGGVGVGTGTEANISSRPRTSATTTTSSRPRSASKIETGAAAAVTSSLSGTTKMTPRQHSLLPQDIFHALDKDQDKVVSKKEFFMGMRKLGIDADRLLALWRSADPKQKGFLTYDRFVALLQDEDCFRADGLMT